MHQGHPRPFSNREWRTSVWHKEKPHSALLSAPGRKSRTPCWGCQGPFPGVHYPGEGSGARPAPSAALSRHRAGPAEGSPRLGLSPQPPAGTVRGPQHRAPPAGLPQPPAPALLSHGPPVPFPFPLPLPVSPHSPWRPAPRCAAGSRRCPPGGAAAPRRPRCRRRGAGTPRRGLLHHLLLLLLRPHHRRGRARSSAGSAPRAGSRAGPAAGGPCCARRRAAGARPRPARPRPHRCARTRPGRPRPLGTTPR